MRILWIDSSGSKPKVSVCWFDRKLSFSSVVATAAAGADKKFYHSKAEKKKRWKMIIVDESDPVGGKCWPFNTLTNTFCMIIWLFQPFED